MFDDEQVKRRRTKIHPVLTDHFEITVMEDSDGNSVGVIVKPKDKGARFELTQLGTEGGEALYNRVYVGTSLSVKWHKAT